MLDPNHTNRMTCGDCGWSRIIDHEREYRGTHTNPADDSECAGMLNHVEIDEREPDPLWFEEEDPDFTPTWI